MFSTEIVMAKGAEIRCLNINESILFVFDRAQK